MAESEIDALDERDRRQTRLRVLLTSSTTDGQQPSSSSSSSSSTLSTSHPRASAHFEDNSGGKALAEPETRDDKVPPGITEKLQSTSSSFSSSFSSSRDDGVAFAVDSYATQDGRRKENVGNDEYVVRKDENDGSVVKNDDHHVNDEENAAKNDNYRDVGKNDNNNAAADDDNNVKISATDEPLKSDFRDECLSQVTRLLLKCDSADTICADAGRDVIAGNARERGAGKDARSAGCDADIPKPASLSTCSSSSSSSSSLLVEEEATWNRSKDTLRRNRLAQGETPEDYRFVIDLW